ncbi:MAG: hypothetical protein ABIM40_01790 [Pseudomonadota bacterium]
MKPKLIMALCLAAFLPMSLVGCLGQQKVVKTPAPAVMAPARSAVESCPLPSGFILENAIATAESTLSRCPMKFDEVFASLLEVAGSRPQTENGIKIHAMLKRLTDKGVVSWAYANELYGRYFKTQFVSLPDCKPHQLPERMEAVKIDLARELEQKRMGLKTACALDGEFVKAEKEYARVLRFLDDLSYNVEYMQRAKQK